MPYTQREFDAVCRSVCPHCAKGHTARQRSDTKEWVHDIGGGQTQKHTICMATHFRNSEQPANG